MENYHEDLAYEHTKKLTQWKRFIGSEGEAKAREAIYEEFTGMGLECKREPFTCSDFAVKILLRAAIGIATVFLFLITYFYALDLFVYSFLFALILLCLVPVINSFMSGTTMGSGLGTQFESENLVGIMKAKTSPAKRRVYIMSHYDTKSQTFSLIMRVLLFVFGLVGGIVIIVLALIFSGIQLLTGNDYLNGTLLFFSSLVICGVLILLQFNRNSNNSVGATDNAAAVGVQVAIIRCLQDVPAENTDVYFLATSAEEIGLFGAIAYAEKHENELDKENTYFINYDVIGAPSDAVGARRGRIVITNKYGLPPKTTSEEINNLLLEITAEKELEVGTRYLPTGAMADNFPFLKRGFKTTWIQAGDTMVTKSIHSPRDNMALITKESLRNAIVLGYEFIQKIDKKA